jgi:hypothetical protein
MLQNVKLILSSAYHSEKLLLLVSRILKTRGKVAIKRAHKN